MNTTINGIINVWNATWETVVEMAPYLLLGFAIAGIFKVLIRRAWVIDHLGGKGWLTTIKATLIGVPMPLCSCGVIPVATALKNRGAGKGATAAFLSSTPQTGVDSVLATWGMLGWPVAIVRLISAFASGILSGWLVDHFDHERIPQTSPDPKEKSSAPVVHTSLRQKIKAALKYGFYDLPGDIGGSVIIGLLIAGVVSAVIPQNALPGYVTGGFTGLVLVTLMAVPVYVCSTGSIPIAVALVHAGFPVGTAFVFLVAGPATNAATVSALWKVMGRQSVMLYLTSIIVVSWITGGLLNLMNAQVLGYVTHSGMDHSGMSESTWTDPLAGGLLLLVLVFPIIREKMTKNGKTEK
ncbi:MAG: permease [Spartobacteria bacterium]|nr:permease [Spartobacteria bacterium]